MKPALVVLLFLLGGCQRGDDPGMELLAVLTQSATQQAHRIAAIEARLDAKPPGGCDPTIQFPGETSEDAVGTPIPTNMCRYDIPLNEKFVRIERRMTAVEVQTRVRALDANGIDTRPRYPPWGIDTLGSPKCVAHNVHEGRDVIVDCAIGE